MSPLGLILVVILVIILLGGIGAAFLPGAPLGALDTVLARVALGLLESS